MIRRATEKDILAIAEMAIMMWKDNTIEGLAESFTEIIHNEESAIFLILIEHETVGFAQCQMRHDYVEGTDSSPIGYLEGIFIMADFRRQGFAKRLLEKCEEWAKEKGCFEFASDCELDNESSTEFHIRMGFKEANRIICFTKLL